MDMELLRETLGLLRQHIASGTSIELEVNELQLQDLAEMLNTYEFTRNRKMTILACCILVILANGKHRQVTMQRNDGLTTSILDGDYYIGLMYRLATSCKEGALMLHLTTLQKRMQLSHIKGRTTDEMFPELKREIRVFLDRQCA